MAWPFAFQLRLPLKLAFFSADVRIRKLRTFPADQYDFQNGSAQLVSQKMNCPGSAGAPSDGHEISARTRIGKHESARNAVRSGQRV